MHENGLALSLLAVHTIMCVTRTRPGRKQRWLYPKVFIWVISGWWDYGRIFSFFIF